MEYIVFDLEWNQCPMGKDFANPRLPFEIIEIGAVKLSESLDIVDTYHALVRPTVYRQIHYQTRKVIHLTMKRLMQEGRPFREVAREFLAWCGEEPRFCIWGTTDLTELQRNLDYYRMGNLLPGPILYEDVQKLFALTYETRKDRRALSYAVDFLKMEDEGGFHEALEDAVYTARILQRIPEQCIRENYSIDCYRNPKSKEDEIRIRYANYEKYISRTFPDRDVLLADRGVSAVRCFACGKIVKRKVPWFSENGRNHLAVGFCPVHGHVKSKIRVRQDQTGSYYAIRTTKMVDELEMEDIRERYLQKLQRQKGQPPKSQGAKR